MSDSYDRMKAQKDRIEADNGFLHKRRGELVLERDRALRALQEMVECFDSEGPWPYSAEEGCERMERAVVDAKSVLRDHHMLSTPADAALKDADGESHG